MVLVAGKVDCTPKRPYCMLPAMVVVPELGNNEVRFRLLLDEVFLKVEFANEASSGRPMILLAIDLEESDTG